MTDGSITIGRVSYVVTAANLITVTPGNTLSKYADDMYIIIPASNVDSRAAELDDVTAWSSVVAVCNCLITEDSWVIVYFRCPNSRSG